MTHLPCADEDLERDARARSSASARSASGCGELKPDVILHAANSAATLALPESRFDMVRCGVAIYGLDPFGVDPADARPRAGARAALVRRGAEAARAGRERRLRRALRRARADVDRDAADRLRRRLAARVLRQRRGADRRAPPSARRAREHGQRHGRRRTRPGGHREGDEAVLLGRDGDERITAEALARRDRHDQLRDHDRADRARRRARITATAPRSTRRTAAREPRDARMSDDALAIARQALAGTPAWLVGGAVRDRLLGRPAHGRSRPRRRRATWRPPRARSPRGARRRLPAVGGLRRLARGRARRRLAGRSLAAAGRDDRAGPRAARLHGQRDRRAAGGRRAGRPDRRAARTSPHGACGWSHRRRSRPIRCACCGCRASPASWRWSPSRRRSRPPRGHAAAARRRRGRARLRGAEADRRLARPARRDRAGGARRRARRRAAGAGALAGVEQSAYHHLDVYRPHARGAGRGGRAGARSGRRSRRASTAPPSPRCWRSRSPTS